MKGILMKAYQTQSSMLSVRCWMFDVGRSMLDALPHRPSVPCHARAKHRRAHPSPHQASGRFTILILAALLLLPGAGAGAATPWRILMLGNSYTDVTTYDYSVWQQLQNFFNADPACPATITRR